MHIISKSVRLNSRELGWCCFECSDIFRNHYLYESYQSGGCRSLFFQIPVASDFQGVRVHIRSLLPSHFCPIEFPLSGPLCSGSTLHGEFYLALYLVSALSFPV
jgi:hypothetical protein